MTPGAQFSEGQMKTCDLSKAEDTRYRTGVDIQSRAEAGVIENI